MRYPVAIDGRDFEVEITQLPDGKLRLAVGEQVYEAGVVSVNNGAFLVRVEDKVFDLSVVRDQDGWLVVSPKASRRIRFGGRRSAARASARASESEVRAVMPGRVVNLLVRPGDSVEVGQGLIVIEAMKMENEIKASKSGTVAAVNVEVGRAVEKGDILIVIE